VQDLLTAKTTIAAQTDRLMSHYRSQIAQYEAEVTTMPSSTCLFFTLTWKTCKSQVV